MQHARCTCGRAFVEINLDVGGQPVIMRSCSACDVRSWHGPEGELPLDGILDGLSAAVAKR